MARDTFENWIPEEYTGTPLTTIRTNSAIVANARHIPMSSDTKKVPRAGGVDPAIIAKGDAYPERVNVNDNVILDAVKVGAAIRIAEEDIDDSFVNILDTEKNEYAKNHAVFLDNAAIGTTAAGNGSTVPFDSVYYEVSTADTAVGYVAGANLTKTAGAVTYDKLSAVLAILEGGNYFGNLVVIAHPFFKSALRGIKDTQGNPIFVQGLAGTPDTIFGYNVVWSQGAKTNATASANPTGNPLLVVANSDFLLMGDRTTLETFFIDPRTGLAALTDEALLKFRQRVAFRVGNPNAVAVLEVTAA